MACLRIPIGNFRDSTLSRHVSFLKQMTTDDEDDDDD